MAGIRYAGIVCVAVAGLLCPDSSEAQTSAAMHDDHRAVLIADYASGSETGSSITSITINGIDFMATIPANFSTPGRYDGVAPLETCQLLRDQIAAYTTGLSTVPEFQAGCITLPGEACLLVVQANPKRYPVATEDEPESQAWIKAKRRHLYMQAESSDSTQSVSMAK